MNSLVDRNFDPIADHFVNKVYGGLKGDIRLSVLNRDITLQVEQLTSTLKRPLRVLDIGAGLAQISLELAANGHDVTINDISDNMLTKAKEEASRMGILEDVRWLTCPYQELDNLLDLSNMAVKGNEDAGDKLDTAGEKYDLILCHAVLEWLGQPRDIMAFFSRWLSQEGCLSLCFYNPVSFVYRNLIMGNFNLLNNPDYQADNKRSLTPNHPVSFEEVACWLKENSFGIWSVTGLRVFHDYSPLKRGGHTNPDAVIEMELRYSTQAPYKWLGRYLHVVAYRGQNEVA